MIKAVIVGDDKDNVLRIKDILVRYGREYSVDFRITCFSSGIDFISDYSADYDIVFMAIDMPHLDGLKTAQLMRALDSRVSLVFVTKHAKYAIDGYELGACNYLLKPFDYETFCKKMSGELERLKKLNDPFLFVKSKNNIRKVYHSEIYYITVHGRYVLLHTKSGVVEMHVSMKEVEQLLEGSNFVRGDNSSMVNLMYVTEVNMEGAVVGGELVPCSRPRRKALWEAFTAYLR